MSGPHILIYEPSTGGHQMVLIRYLLNAIVQHTANPRVTMLMSEAAARHPATAAVLGDFAGTVTPRVAPAIAGGSLFWRTLHPFYEYQWRNAEAFAKGFAEIGPDNVDFVLLPYLETVGLLHIALRPNLFRGLPWAAVAITISFHHRKFGIASPLKLTELLQGLFLRRVLNHPALTCLGSVNPLLADAIRHPRLAHCPDPGTPYQPAPAAEARAAYGIRPETCLVVVFGVIDHRKCVDVLLEGAARVIPDLDVTVLLAGPQNTTDMAPILNGAAARKLREHGRLVEAKRYIHVGKDIDPLSAADITWVFYESAFVVGSSVMVRAGLFHRPVIGRDLGVIGRQMREYDCGLALPSGAPEEVAAALTRLARDPDLRRRLGGNGARAFARNTPENFARPIVDAINRAVAGARSGRGSNPARTGYQST